MSLRQMEFLPLGPKEIGIVERFLLRSTLQSRSTLRLFLAGLAGELGRVALPIQARDVRAAAALSHRWLRMIRGPMFGRSQWAPWAPLSIEIEITCGRQKTGIRPKLRFSVADHYLNELLVRAIANGQIHNFIECEFCGSVKHVKIFRKGDKHRFCTADHRAAFHYLVSRRGAKDLLQERRKWRAQGIPCSVQDIRILRESRVTSGSPAARNLLSKACLPLQGLDSSELDTLRRGYIGPFANN